MITHIKVPFGSNKMEHEVDIDFDLTGMGKGWFVIMPEGHFKKYPSEFEAKLYVAGEPRAKFIGLHTKFVDAIRAAFNTSSK